jgi:UDP-N-acetylmuramoyl-L-alanyl-D-glutamate--2,6-diaminopimelate ligase
VLNLDDEFGASLAETLDQDRVNVLGYGLGRGDVRGSDLQVDESTLAMVVQTPWGDGQIHSGLIGSFNASNLLGVLAALLVSDVALDAALQQLSLVQAPPGRMQRIGGDGVPLVVVDYAHTPDALEKVLRTLREIMALPKPDGGGRVPVLTCVFGCGGERDKGKRPLMGEVVSRLADSVIVTSDNPRGEDAQAIIADITAGLRANHHVIEDRASAIFHAIEQAQPGDVVLIAGKGHEQYQEIHGDRLPFSDMDVAQRALSDAHRRTA